MTKTVAIIQARMTSERLPGKALIEVNGKPILQHVIDRVRQAKTIDHIVVATSTDPTDDPIVDWCEDQVSCFRGSLNNVLWRYYQCASLHKADNIARITADCPLLNPNILDQTIQLLIDKRAGYAATAGFTQGIGQEAFTYAALELTHISATSDYDREHVVTWMIDNPNKITPAYLINQALTLDTPEDLQRLTPLLT